MVPVPVFGLARWRLAELGSQAALSEVGMRYFYAVLGRLLLLPFKPFS